MLNHIRRKKSLIVLFVAVFVFVGFTLKAQATTYYVSPTGNEADGKSWATAWKTFGHIKNSVLRGGDVVYIDGGPSDSSMQYYTPNTTGEANEWLISGIANTSVTNKVKFTRAVNDSQHNGTVIIGDPGTTNFNKKAQIKIWNDNIILDGGDRTKFKVYVGDVNGNSSIYLGYSVGDNIELRNITFLGEDYDGASSGVTMSVYGDNTIISGNEFNKSGGEDLLGVNTDGNLIIENNIFRNMLRSENGDVHRDAMSMYGHPVSGQKITIRNNYFINNDSDNVYMMGKTSDAFGTVEVYNNVFYDVNTSIKVDDRVASMQGLYVYNNTFIRDNDDQDAVMYIHQVDGVANNTKITNNIFSVKQVLLAGTRDDTFSNNLWDKTVGTPAYIPGNGNIEGDPKFLSRGVNNLFGADGIPFTADDGYNIQETSNAVNAGRDVSDIRPKDILGKSPNGITDIGAFEYSGNVPTDIIPPSVSITGPASPVKGTATISATASDNVAVGGVKFYVDSVQVGSEDTTYPYSVSWNTTGVSNSTHTITAVARDTSYNTKTSDPVVVTVSNIATTTDTIPPVVSITAPANGSTVAGTATISATASDNVGVVGVQFAVDGTNVAAEDTTFAYSISWNTAAVTNGSHTIKATARDAAGNIASTTVVVTVNNIIIGGRTLTVKKTGGDYTTIQACANTAVAGDTCLVYGNTAASPTLYDERVTLSKAGTTASPITFRATPAKSVQMRGFDAKADYNTIDGFFITGDYSGIGTAPLPGNKGLTLTNNLIQDVQTGMDLHGDNMTVAGNEINHLIDKSNGTGAGDADYILFFGNNISFTGNYLHGTDGSKLPSVYHTDCFQTYWDGAGYAHNVTIDSNFCADSDEGVIAQDYSTAGGQVTNITIKNNIFKNILSEGIELKNVNGGYVYNNVLADVVWYGIRIRDGAVATVKNNILYNNDSADNDYVIILLNDGAKSLDESNNLIYSPGKAIPASAYPRDIVGRDPLFNNSTANDYALKSGSPAIDAGASLTGLVDVDKNGSVRPQGNGWDIGAYETGGSVVPTTTPSGLVVALGFNEGIGKIISDASGNGNTGTAKRAAWVVGKYGKGMNFNGTSDWVSIADSPSLDLTSGMTLEAWVKPTINMTKWRTVIVKETANSAAYYLYANSDQNTPAAGINNGNLVESRGGIKLPANVWSHIASTYDGSSLKIYVNGVLVSSQAISGNITVSDGALRIGGNNIWPEFFRGVIDEVRVYGRALSSDEIVSDMKTPVSAIVSYRRSQMASTLQIQGQVNRLLDELRRLLAR